MYPRNAGGYCKAETESTRSGERSSVASSAFDVALSPTLSEELQTPLGKADNFALVVILDLVVRLDLAVRNLLDHLHDVV
jgi:hypothetical protein